MIIVEVKKNNGNIDKINIKGHANYDSYGKDIVCSAVSSIVTTTVNGILMFDETINYNEKENDFSIKVLKNNDITNKLLLNMINLLEELESDYPKNIKILEEE